MAEPGITQAEIEAGLHALGLPAGAAVEVHCSLSAFGWVHGGASAVIAALQQVVGQEGTLVMSAYPVSPPVSLSAEDVARGISWKVRRLAEDAPDRTGMGVVADTFRRQPDVRCGTGLFRTCAWGKHADQHCAGYDALLEQDGWTLLLGVGIERCSSMHAAERSLLPEAIAVYERVPDAVRRHYDPECWSVGWGGMPDDAWAKVFAAADRQGLIRHAWIGRAPCHLFRTRAVVASYAEWRRADPWDLYGVPRPADLSD